MLVKVYDRKGLNFTIKSRNAIDVVKLLLHSINANYVVIDLMHAYPDKDEDADYVVIIDA